MAHVKCIRFKPTLASQKVVTVITAKDIPNGRNIMASMFGSELFADSHTEYAGQPVGLVVSVPSYSNITEILIFLIYCGLFACDCLNIFWLCSVVECFVWFVLQLLDCRNTETCQLGCETSRY